MIVDPLREYGGSAVEVSGPEELAAYLERTGGRWRVSYHNDQLNEDFPQLCNAVYALGECLFIVEEADWFCEPASIPEEFEHLIKYGRHNAVAICAVCRRPSELHRMLTSQAYEVYCFVTQEPRDLEYLARYVGRDFAEDVQTLGPHEHRYMNLWDRSGGRSTEEPEKDEREQLPAGSSSA